MHIITYPHPTLRYSSKTIRRVDAELRRIVQEMFELMYEAKGVGLAATQVDLPLRFFIVNLESDPTKADEMIYINPVISHAKGSEEAEEGCLSLPGLYGPVRRPKQVRISAFNLAGEEIREDATGLLARVVQHEFDHLNGVLFTDRMTDEARLKLREDMIEMEQDYHQALEAGEIPSEQIIAGGRAEWEKRYC